MRRQDEHPTLTSMAMGGQLDKEAFPYDAQSVSAVGPPQWGPRLARIMRELLPPQPRIRGPSRNNYESRETYENAQDEFKVAVIQEKTAYTVWFKAMGGNKYLTRWHVNGEHGMIVLRTPNRAFARRGLCKPCKKYYDDSKGLEKHEQRHHGRPQSQDSGRVA